MLGSSVSPKERSSREGSWSERSGLRDMAVDLLQKTLYLIIDVSAVLQARICVRWKDPLHEKDQDPSHRGQPDIARWHQGRHRCADRSQNCRNIRRKSRYSAAGAELETSGGSHGPGVTERKRPACCDNSHQGITANESDRDGSDPLPTGHRGVRAGRRGGLCPQRRDNRGGPQNHPVGSAGNEDPSPAVNGIAFHSRSRACAAEGERDTAQCSANDEART